MKIGVITIAYNEEETIRGAIRCMKPFADTHVVLISEQPYFGRNKFLKDRTEEICLEEDVDIIKGTWDLDHFQRNNGIAICQKNGCDWVLGIDADELITECETERLIKHLENTTYPAISVHPIMYWKGLNRILSPKPTYTPIIALRSNVRFNYIRNIGVPYEQWYGEYHHLTWAKSHESIYKKISTYAHAPDCDWDTWFKTVYEKWTDGNDITFPNISDQVYTAVNYNIPEELKKHLCEYKS